MPNPKRRTSKARRDKRRTHWKMALPNLSICPHCHEAKLSHRVCPNCGYYEDRQILTVEKA